MAVSKRIIPDMQDALTDLRGLVALGRDNVDVAKCLDGLIESGTPLFRGQIDRSVTKSAGDFVVSYQLADELLVCLATMRARQIETVSKDTGVFHDEYSEL